ncbi:unnamed protein product [Penicillium olsonii]|nr:unnamed protein product [Penicillium olsonii]CAG7929553.1 unnamed protein product [Penicillium olsonii]
MATTQHPSVVFIPGAWHLPEGFDGVREVLSARGYQTDAVSLPSVGAEVPKNLSDDTAAARHIIEQRVEEGKQVVVVAHSYGGLVGSGAVRDLGYVSRQAAGKQGGVIMLIYMAAFVATKGSAVLDLLGGAPPPWMDFADNNYIHLSNAANAATILYNDLSPSEQEKRIAKWAPMSKAAFLEPVSHEPWLELPCMYLIAENDQALPLAAQEAMASMLGTNPSYRCAGSHFSYLDLPEKVADAVELGAQQGLKRC